MNYITPELNISLFAEKDVITTSGVEAYIPSTSTGSGASVTSLKGTINYSSLSGSENSVIAFSK